LRCGHALEIASQAFYLGENRLLGVHDPTGWVDELFTVSRTTSGAAAAAAG